jgi:TonB family protein
LTGHLYELNIQSMPHEPNVQTGERPDTDAVLSDSGWRHSIGRSVKNLVRLQPVRLLSIAAALCAAAILSTACASRDEYIVPGSAHPVSKEQAERLWVERAVGSQEKWQIDSPIRVRRASLPSYPPAWKHLDHVPVHRVTVRFTLSETGAVDDAEIVGEAEPELAERCTSALYKWQFEPVTRGGKPVSLRLSFEFVFVLQD